MNTVDVLPLPAALVDALRGVCTATLTTVLLKKGLRNVWMRGTKPLQAGGERLVGRAFTLRFVPAREDLATPASWGKPISTRARQSWLAVCGLPLRRQSTSRQMMSRHSRRRSIW